MTPKPTNRILALAIIAIPVLLISYYFLETEPSDFPMGDSYIHFVYARNLIEHGELSFNPGIREGVGTTSPLWVVILSGFLMVGSSPLITAKVLGITLLIAYGYLIFELAFILLNNFSSKWPFRGALFIAVLAVVPGNNIWIALSGMETLLFTFLGLLAIRIYLSDRYLLSGVVLGLMALTRIEGIALAAVLLALDFARHRRIRAGSLRMVIPLLTLLLPWIVYIQIREGVPVPSSFGGKRFASAEAARLVLERYPLLKPILAMSPIVYLLTWSGYSLLYLYGGIALPGPGLNLPGLWEGVSTPLPVASVLVSGFLIFPLFFRGIRYLINQRTRIILENRAHRTLLAILGWSILHNLVYAIFLPEPGAAGRYAPMNHLLFWLTILLGAWFLRNRLLRGTVILSVVLLAGFSIHYWREVYQANIDYMQEVRIPASQFIDTHYAEDVLIGTTDLGPLRWYARQPVIDLIGYVNKDIVAFRNAGGSYVAYLIDRDINHLHLFMPVEGYGVDTSEVMELGESERLAISEESTYATSSEAWLFGSAAVGNYMPAISIYRIVSTEKAQASSTLDPPNP